MATTSNSSREERRRRIVEKGLDRLALITGARSVTSSPLSSPHSHASLRISTSFDHQAPRSNLSNQTNAGAVGSSGATASTMLQHEAIINALKVKTSDIGKPVEPEQSINDTSKQTMQALVVDDKTKSGSSLVTSTVAKPSNNTEPISRPIRNQLNMFSCKQVNSCIVASQKTRSICSLIIAILVVLSWIEYPFLGLNISSRPVYLLLVTDIIIVLSRLYLEDQKHSEDAEKKSAESDEDGDNFTQALKVMERGLLVYQSIRAFFIDFSIYTAVVVSCLSLV